MFINFKNIKFSFAALLFLFPILIIAASSGTIEIKKIEMPDLLRPSAIYSDSQQFYIVDRDTIRIYRKNDLTPVATFGETGEGPRQFKSNPGNQIELNFHQNELAVTSPGKLSYFKKDGTYIKEVRLDGKGKQYPFGEGFVILDKASNESEKLYIALFLADANLNKIKQLGERVLFQIDMSSWTRYMFLPEHLPCFYEEKVYLPVGTGMKIVAYDQTGREVLNIDYKYKNPPVTPSHIKKTHEVLKKNAHLYQATKDRLVFPKYFPAIKMLKVTDKYIYVETFRRLDEDKQEFFIFTAKGKFVQKASIPLHYEDITKTFPYTISDAKLYQLVEDIDEETWYMYTTPIALVK